MTKQLIALALAAAFGIAHAADTKTGAAATGTTSDTTAASGTSAPKKMHKHAHKKVHKKTAGMSDQSKTEAATPAQPASPATK